MTDDELEDAYDEVDKILDDAKEKALALYIKIYKGDEEEAYRALREYIWENF
jgi:F0F1-type ATP synthase membrane subunit b/b'